MAISMHYPPQSRCSKPLPIITGVLVTVILLTTLFVSLASEISLDDDQWNYDDNDTSICVNCTTNFFDEMLEYPTESRNTTSSSKIHSVWYWQYIRIPLFALFVGFELATVILVAWTCSMYCCAHKKSLQISNTQEQVPEIPPPEYQPPPPYQKCVINMNANDV